MADLPVYIIESNAFLQRMLSSIFLKLGLQSRAAQDLQTAAGVLAAESFSFVLLEAGLPGVITGETAPYLQSIMPKPTPVILMVPETDPNPQLTLAHSRTNGYIVKPFTESEIRSWLEANGEALLGRPFAVAQSTLDADDDPELSADPGEVEAWLRDLKSGEAQAQIAACEGLSRFRVKRSVQPLVDLSYEGDGAVKIAAVRALGKLGDKAATEAILANLNVPDQELKEAALEALGELQDPRALRPLSRILRVPDKKMVLLAIKALGMLRCQEAKEILGTLVNNPDPQIKANVQWAIRVIDGMDL